MSFPAAEVRWLFFDLGNTLVDEGAAWESRMGRLAGCLERDVEDIRRAFADASAEFAPRLITRVLERLTDDPDLRRRSLAEARYPKELEAPHDGAEEAVRTLSRRYRIGVIANQSAGSEARLTQWGLMPFVSICLASAELGLEKPDPAIFRLALSRAECAAEEAVMIGDRLDKDIRPARLQGWRTIRVLQGFARFQTPRDAFDEADATVVKLAELLPLFEPAAS